MWSRPHGKNYYYRAPGGQTGTLYGASHDHGVDLPTNLVGSGGPGPGPTKPAFIAAGIDSLAASAWKVVGEIWNMGAEMESFAPKGHAGCSR